MSGAAAHPDLLEFAQQLGIDLDDELLPEALRVPLTGKCTRVII
jgi:hypothetical protein|eukprot:COSAG01_NODE_3765_length_5722_cov_6.999644_2_plen_44_part_00